jgi:hypothetical protein
MANTLKIVCMLSRGWLASRPWSPRRRAVCVAMGYAAGSCAATGGGRPRPSCHGAVPVDVGRELLSHPLSSPLSLCVGVVVCWPFRFSARHVRVDPCAAAVWSVVALARQDVYRPLVCISVTPSSVQGVNSGATHSTPSAPVRLAIGTATSRTVGSGHHRPSFLAS